MEKNQFCLPKFISIHKSDYCQVRIKFCLTKFITMDKSHFCPQKWVLPGQNSIQNLFLSTKVTFVYIKKNHKSSLPILCTQLTSVWQNSLLWYRIDFCWTAFTFVNQNRHLCYKIDLCEKELNFMLQNLHVPLWVRLKFCWTESNFVGQNWILRDIIEFCVTRNI